MDEEVIRELFDSLGPVRISRMFGGQGIYSDGLIIAVVVGGELMLKADAQTAPEFEAAGSTRWSYARENKQPVKMPYWRLPGTAYDDPTEMAEWAARALDAARRSVTAKKNDAARKKATARTLEPS